MTDSQIVTAKEEGSERTAPRIYVASRASIPARPAMWRAFRAEGYPIVSTWIDEAGEGESASLPDLWRRIHQETHGAALVLFAPPEDGPWKGAFVEVGLTLASGGRVFVAGDHRHLGSWVWGPGVTLCADVRDAMDAARAWTESSPARSPSDPLGSAKNARVLATRAADKRAGREVGDHVSAEEARTLLDVWAIHADSNAGKVAAAPDLAATVVALSEERDSERTNGDDLADAVIALTEERDRLRTALLSVVTTAKNATLPLGFIWGHDVMEQFNFGKERAAQAIAEAIEAADRAAGWCAVADPAYTIHVQGHRVWVEHPIPLGQLAALTRFAAVIIGVPASKAVADTKIGARLGASFAICARSDADAWLAELEAAETASKPPGVERG